MLQIYSRTTVKECLPEQTLQLAAKTSLFGVWTIIRLRPAFILRWKSWRQTTDSLPIWLEPRLDAEEENCTHDGRDRAAYNTNKVGENLLSRKKKAVTNLKSYT